jgi:streptogramin lyase
MKMCVLVSALAITCAASADDLLVADYGNSIIRRYDASTGAYIDDVIMDPALTNPHGFAIDAAGNFYVSDETGNVWKYSPSGAALGSFTGVIAAALDRVTFGPDGRLWVSNYATGQVEKYDQATGAPAGVAATGGGLSTPNGFLIGPDGRLYVASEDTDSVKRFDAATGAYIDDFVAAGSGGLDQPVSLTFGPDGHLYVPSIGTNDVKRFDGATGAFIDNFASGGGLSFPVSAWFGPNGNLFVGGAVNTALKEFDGATGVFIADFTTPNANGITHFMFVESPCYPDCNADGVLTVADFGCFQTQFVLGTSYADCNQDGVRTVADFGCFQTRFVQGCP